MKLVIKKERSPSSQQEQEIIGFSNSSKVIRQKRSALKVLMSNCVDQLVHEYQVLKQLEHPNIIKLASEKPFKMCQEYERVGLSLELGHIDLFHFLKQSQPSRLNTSTVRDVFKQLALALSYLHEKKSFAHNDIKLENILLFFNRKDQTQLTPKLIDFGLASSTQVSSASLYLNWQNRSPNNLPPEIIEQLNLHKMKIENSVKAIQSDSYLSEESSSVITSEDTIPSPLGEFKVFDLSKCDVFQFGLTLFNALFLSNPFSCQDENFNYEHFIKGHPEQYWNQSCVQKLLDMIRVDSQEEELNMIIDLFNQVFKHSPNERPSITKVLSHSWFSK